METIPAIKTSFKILPRHPLSSSDFDFLKLRMRSKDSKDSRISGMLTIRSLITGDAEHIPAMLYSGHFEAYNFHNPVASRGIVLHPSFSPILSAMYLNSQKDHKDSRVQSVQDILTRELYMSLGISSGDYLTTEKVVEEDYLNDVNFAVVHEPLASYLKKY